MRFVRKGFVMLMVVFTQSAAVIETGIAAPKANIEVFDPYDVWLEGERWGVYVKITNTGNESFRLLTHPDTLQLFLEASLGEPSRPLPQNILEDSLPKVEEAQWGMVEQAAAWRGTVEVGPGEQFVYGPEAFIDIEGLHALQSRRLSRYRVHILLADSIWSSSPLTERRFAVDNQAWKQKPIAEVPLRTEGRGSLVRKISVAGESWLFEGSFRLCRAPADHQLNFMTHGDARDLLEISFAGIEGGKVLIDNRMGNPISGPPELVPQLALWQRLTNRPMGWATSETQAEPARNLQMGQNDTDPGRSRLGDDRAIEEEGLSTEAVDATRWPWIAAGGCLLLAALWMIGRRTS